MPDYGPRSLTQFYFSVDQPTRYLESSWILTGNVPACIKLADGSAVATDWAFVVQVSEAVVSETFGIASIR